VQKSKSQTERRKRTRNTTYDGHFILECRGKPISAEEFLQNLFDTFPDFFKSEEELRTIWGNLLTRRTLLEKLADTGFGKEELTTLQKLIEAE